jgi:predicted TIM-barrel fold metal-dependent hydrolase
MIVDVHHHYADPAHYTQYKDFPAQLVEAMDRYGWDWVCLNGVGIRYHNKENRDVAEAVARFPNRLVGIGYLDVDRKKPGYVDELRSMGMRGLKIIGTHLRYDDDLYLPLYERAAVARLPILFHTGFLGGETQPGPRDECSDNYRPIMLDRIARLFPDLVMIAAHMGTLLWFQEGIEVTCRHPNVYGDFSGGVGSEDPDFYRMPIHRRINWNKVLFGSDSLPNDAHIPFNAVMRLMADLKVDPGTQRNVLGETAARIFGLGRDKQ